MVTVHLFTFDVSVSSYFQALLSLDSLLVLKLERVSELIFMETSETKISVIGFGL